MEENPVSFEELFDDKHHARVLKFKKGETIIKQHAFVSNILYLKTGLVKLILEGDHEKDMILKIVAPGQFFGIPAIKTDNYYPYSAVALKSSDIHLIDIRGIREMVKKDISFANKIIDWYTKDYKYLYDKLINMGTKQLHGRLADAILYLSRKKFLDEDIFSCLTRNEISELAAMSPESMSRLLNEFKNDKLIITKGRQIIINDEEMLRRLVKM
jgi:CRP/FNR family transcriptional regulator, polysaccharide utilization system transcription regulator